MTVVKARRSVVPVISRRLLASAIHPSKEGLGWRMSSVQKLVVLMWDFALAILLVFLFARGQFGLILWTFVTNLLLQFGTIRSSKQGIIRINGTTFERQENSSVFS